MTYIYLNYTKSPHWSCLPEKDVAKKLKLYFYFITLQLGMQGNGYYFYSNNFKRSIHSTFILFLFLNRIHGTCIPHLRFLLSNFKPRFKFKHNCHYNVTLDSLKLHQTFSVKRRFCRRPFGQLTCILFANIFAFQLLSAVNYFRKYLHLGCSTGF